VLMLGSDNGGSTWYFSCNSITGASGFNILSGSGKHIVWDFSSEHPDTHGDQYRVKIIADDGKFETGTVTDIDENVYQTVKIGDQWWMAENLKVTHYRSGEAIPNVTDGVEWSNLSNGACCSYDKADSNIAIYGLLYNWFAVADSQNIAPAGWHVPSNLEWQVLVDYLGGDPVAGGKMKASGTIQSGDGLWQEPNEGATNESGFSALPGGSRGIASGYYFNIGYYGLWWSATEYYSNYAWYNILGFSYSDIIRYYYSNKQDGFSVRCVRD